MVEYRWLHELPPAGAQATASLYTQSFAESLDLIAPDLGRWADYLERSISKERTLVAVRGGEVIGAISYSRTGRREALSIRPLALVTEFGLRLGIRATWVLAYEFMAPLPWGAGRIPYIELLAVAPESRGQGVAHGLIAELVERLAASGYSIQVDGNNDAGLALYESLGFREVGRIDEPWSAAQKAGTMERVFMQLNVSDGSTKGSPHVEARTDSDRG